jgi:flagellar FliL protein
MTKDIRTEFKRQSKDIEASVMDLQEPIYTNLKGTRTILTIVILVLTLCGGVAYLFTAFFRTNSDESKVIVNKDGSTTHKNVEDFYDMDEMVVNLASTTNQRRYLKLRVSFRLAGAQDNQVVVDNARAIQDSFFVFLKELRAEDLSSSGATMRLKEELMKRVNKIIYPAEVRDLLFKEILVD